MKFTYKANCLKKKETEIHEVNCGLNSQNMTLILHLEIHMPSIPSRQEGSRVAQQPAGELLISRVIFRAWQLIRHIVCVEVTVEAEQAVSYLDCLCPPILLLGYSVTWIDIYLLSRTELGRDRDAGSIKIGQLPCLYED